jgi:hypothetical protein
MQRTTTIMQTGTMAMTRIRFHTQQVGDCVQFTRGSAS